ncbi:MAG: hypothetical protein EU541_04280 [Promethearchaeota archaeon]|nr:MAG: hypothetical protein EU541_04280 [Candidatus Lokiarchaeota archaeon]
MKNLLIAGGGKFGKKALDFAKTRNFHTIIIDKNPYCLASEYVSETFVELDKLLERFKKSREPNLFLLQKDISTINNLILNTEIQFEYIIPVVPIHLMALIIKNLLNDHSYDINTAKELCLQATHNFKEDLLLNHICEQGVIYLSYAKEGEICPDDCPGPPNYCPNFDREKPVTITQYVKNYFNVSDTFSFIKDKKRIIITIHSHQLKSGLGGLKGKEVTEVISNLSDNLGYILKNKLELIIGTTCNCHGVINFFKSSNSSS